MESMVRALFPDGKIQKIKLDEDDGVSYYEVMLKDGKEKIDPVSYTHLTLPTICSV